MLNGRTDMDQKTATKVLRLTRLEKRAEAHQERAEKSGNIRQAFRAANLVMAVHARWGAILGAEITTYAD
jgi:hypothetical protein